MTQSSAANKFSANELPANEKGICERQQALLNHFQRDFPVCAEPFAQVAAALNSDEATVLGDVEALREQGVITRLGPVFNHRRAGASTLVAASVSDEELKRVAATIGQHPGVNHSYTRAHEWNLWFVLTAPSSDALREALDHLEQSTGCHLLVLPMVRAYHIDLGFKLDWSEA